MLEINSYVRCLMVDFSKAFNTVDHVILIRKLQASNTPLNVYSLITFFLTGRMQKMQSLGHLVKSHWYQLVNCTELWVWTIPSYHHGK